jgi:ubiquinone/menaquinone biosynthesis C-methylase UbiE
MRTTLDRYLAIGRSTVLRTFVDRYIAWRKEVRMTKDSDRSLDLPSHTVNENKRIWNSYDWSNLGDEWTSEVARCKGIDPMSWKKNLIDNMMLKYICAGGVILELGIGAGRWSEVLQRFSSRLILADIAEKCLEICKERFKNADNVEYYLIQDNLGFLPENTVNYIWSYDVFVHINPSDIEKYLMEFSRILKPGGYGIVHHSGEGRNVKGFRSDMTSEIFRRKVEYYGMVIVEQNTSIPHMNGDVISVFLRPK